MKSKIEGYFTIVENEILDLLPLLGLTKRELEFMIVMVRLNNGFKRLEDRISLSQFFKLTGIYRGDGCNTLKKLIKRKMIYKKDSKIGINKNFIQWEGVSDLLTHKVLANYVLNGSKSLTIGVSDLRHSKESTKERSPKKGDKVSPMTEKEKNKKWLIDEMRVKGSFSQEFINMTLDKLGYEDTYSVWVAFTEKYEHGNRQLFFSNLILQWEYEKQSRM